MKCISGKALGLFQPISRLSKKIGENDENKKIGATVSFAGDVC